MQETITLKLPITGKEVVLKGWVSGAVDAEVQAIIQGGYDVESDIDVDGETAKDTVKSSKMKFSLGTATKAGTRALELMLVSLDGDPTDVFKRVMALPSGDTDFLHDEIDKITEASKIPAKEKKSSASSTS